MAVLAESGTLHGVGFGGTGTNLIIRGRQIFRDLAGLVLGDGAHLVELLVVLLVVRHD